MKKQMALRSALNLVERYPIDTSPCPFRASEKAGREMIEEGFAPCHDRKE